MVDLLRELSALVAPPRCAACDGPADSQQPLCLECLNAVGDEPPLVEEGLAGIDLAVSPCSFERTARAVIHGLKYRGRLRLAEMAAEAIISACPSDELHGTLVPVPPSSLRWRWRGFDSAEEITLALAERTGVPYDPCLRRDHGPRQVGRPRSARLSESPSVRAHGPAPQRALLVDDVRTTGATLAACASALRDAGATEIVAMTFAYVGGACCPAAR